MSVPYLLPTRFKNAPFSGELCAQYLDTHYNGRDVKWAIAGRSQARLEKLQARLNFKVPMIVADSDSLESLCAMAKRTKVVLTTVVSILGKP
jgi:short subunit dehydrogenase-like uncharacterized protein